MKKLIIGMALACFIAFGTVGIQTAVASIDNVEIVNLQLDDDPDKNKKAKADGKAKKGEKACETKKSCGEAKANCETKKNCETKCSDKKSSNKEGGDNK
jgi:hypothetical protein